MWAASRPTPISKQDTNNKKLKHIFFRMFVALLEKFLLTEDQMQYVIAGAKREKTTRRQELGDQLYFIQNKNKKENNRKKKVNKTRQVNLVAFMV